MGHANCPANSGRRLRLRRVGRGSTAAGWEARGCDIDSQAVRAGQAAQRDISVANPEVAPPDGQYDVAILIHTLEHVLDPNASLRNVGSALQTGGLLHIRVPNYGGLLPHLMGNSWGFLVPYQHVWQFTPPILRNVVLRAGTFSEVETTASTAPSQPASEGIKGVVKTALSAGACRAQRGDELSATLRLR
jgi:SAM-dependent methyltransferase